ncbi:MAG: type II toxin-antitoxin system Phd/YefM family antitoxin [Caulobacteraceae bacterium]|nr:type II toxin-antitoxin system Phd/YefM family antitoxin [Caulobacter sp.]
MSNAVPSRDFVGNFERYRERAQTEAVAISTDGDIDGYFVSASEYEALRRAASRLRAFAVEDVPDDMAEAIANARMDPRHAHLDALLDPD